MHDFGFAIAFDFVEGDAVLGEAERVEVSGGGEGAGESVAGERFVGRPSVEGSDLGCGGCGGGGGGVGYDGIGVDGGFGGGSGNCFFFGRGGLEGGFRRGGRSRCKCRGSGDVGGEEGELHGCSK